MFEAVDDAVVGEPLELVVVELVPEFVDVEGIVIDPEGPFKSADEAVSSVDEHPLEFDLLGVEEGDRLPGELVGADLEVVGGGLSRGGGVEHLGGTEGIFVASEELRVI